jgi:hypothetical protein
MGALVVFIRRLQGHDPSVTAALQQLEALGLLAWSPQVIRFLPQAAVLRDALAQDGYRTLRAQLAPGLRSGCRCPAACSAGWPSTGSQG